MIDIRNRYIYTPTEKIWESVLSKLFELGCIWTNNCPSYFTVTPGKHTIIFIKNDLKLFFGTQEDLKYIFGKELSIYDLFYNTEKNDSVESLVSDLSFCPGDKQTLKDIFKLIKKEEQ